MVEPEYKCDEVGLFLFARMYHMHIAVIVNDRVWTTHFNHKLSECSIILGYRGSCDFVLLKPDEALPGDTEVVIPPPVQTPPKPKQQRKPLDLSAATVAKKKEKRRQRCKQKQAADVLNKYKLRSRKRTTRTSKKAEQYTELINTKGGTMQIDGHALKKPKKRTRSYTCYWCNKKYPTHKELNTHIKEVHGDKGFHCRYCGLNFKSFSGRYKHIMIHIGYKYKCGTCSEVFRYPYELRAHERKHTKLGMFPCKEDDCGKEFTTQKALKQHQQVHSPDKFSCDVCNKDFNTKGYLQQHFHVHDKNFVARCGRKCKNPSECQKHQRECGKCMAKKKKFREA